MIQRKLKAAPAYRWWVLVMNCVAYCSFFMTIQITNAFGNAISQQWNLNATKLSLLYSGIMVTFAFTAGLGGKLDSKLGYAKNRDPGSADQYGGGHPVHPLREFLWSSPGPPYSPGLLRRLYRSGRSRGDHLVVPGQAERFGLRHHYGCCRPGFLRRYGDRFRHVVRDALADGHRLPRRHLQCCDRGGLFDGVFRQGQAPRHTSIDEVLKPDVGRHSEQTDSQVSENLPQTMEEARKSKTYKAAAIFGFGNTWLTYGFSAFLSTFLIYDRGIPNESVIPILSITFIVTVIASPLVGVISDKVFGGARYQTMMIATALTSVTLVFASFVPAVLIPVVLVLAYASVSMACRPFWSPAWPSASSVPSVPVLLKSDSQSNRKHHIGGMNHE